MSDGGATVYERVGDALWWGVAALAVAGAFVRKRARPVAA